MADVNQIISCFGPPCNVSLEQGSEAKKCLETHGVGSPRAEFRADPCLAGLASQSPPGSVGAVVMESN